MVDAQILLTALIAVMHVPIWEDDSNDTFKLGCSCGWQRAADGRIRMGYGKGMEADATQYWLEHQEQSARLTRAAIDLATTDA